jgi:ferredoxin
MTLTAATTNPTTTTTTSPTATITHTNDTGIRLRIDPTACTGHGLCAELLAEHITLDEWGYPIIADRDIPTELLRDARRAVNDCPALALRLALRSA